MNALTVSELNEYVRRQLAGDPLLRAVTVRGEISGYRAHISGHKYFQLKDESARVQCVMFRQSAISLDFKPEDGMRVTLRGSASLFVRDGSYQLYVEHMTRDGEGELYLRFEALKRKLTAEGLFDPARKREIPYHPKVIGVATSQTGAAVRDIIRVAKRRDPKVGIRIAPCAVQGASAAKEIVRAIERLNEDGKADVLLVGRGGGSMEDLWCFNEEIVARAIANSRIPVISCVGHEIDFTIADFVADLRAPTPSAAAELAVPVRAELRADLSGFESRLSNAFRAAQRLRRAQFDRLSGSPALMNAARALIEPRRDQTRQFFERALRAQTQNMQKSRHRLDSTARAIKAVDPASVFDRGYAALKKGGKYVRGADALHAGDGIEVLLAGGRLDARVERVTKE